MLIAAGWCLYLERASALWQPGAAWSMRATTGPGRTRARWAASKRSLPRMAALGSLGSLPRDARYRVSEHVKVSQFSRLAEAVAPGQHPGTRVPLLSGTQMLLAG